MNPTRRAYLELHLAVFLFGFTAILGKIISVPETVLVWWRVFFTTISLLFLVDVARLYRTLPRKTFFQFLAIGILVAIHWVTFFGAAKYANVSVCLICMATASFFTALLEPLIMKQKVKWFELGLGLLIIPGMMLVINNTESFMYIGIVMGLISAFLAALFSTLNKKLIDKTSPIEITFLEIGGALLFITILMPFYLYFAPDVQIMPVGMDWVYLVILALVCTTFAYVLSLRALQHITAFAANLTVNLEPVYGILLAIVLLQENKELDSGFYLGVLIILVAIFIYPVLKRFYK
jgi:drug/metabolite transporter (DMT)-like permease